MSKKRKWKKINMGEMFVEERIKLPTKSGNTDEQIEPENEFKRNKPPKPKSDAELDNNWRFNLKDTESTQNFQKDYSKPNVNQKPRTVADMSDNWRKT